MAENELKARITADISGLKSAATQAEREMKQLQTSFTRTAKTITGLETKVKELSAQYKSGSISEKEFTKQTDRLNNELAQQRKMADATAGEMQRLASSSRGLGAGVGTATSSVRGAQPVFMEFNRTIQDAPFGIIGMGNNLQQLAGNFAQLKTSAKASGVSVATALKGALTSTNLLLLGITAATTAWTVYSMSTRGAKEDVDDLKEAQDALNDSMKETDRIAKQGFYRQFLKDIGVLEAQVDSLGRTFIALSGTPEERLQKIADAVKTATKPQLEALADFLNTEYQSTMRMVENSTDSLEKQIGESQAAEYKEQFELVNKQLQLYEKFSLDGAKATKELKDETDDFISSASKLEDLSERISAAYAKIAQELNRGEVVNVDVNANLPINERPETFQDDREYLSKKQLDLLKLAGIEIEEQKNLSDQQLADYKNITAQMEVLVGVAGQLGGVLSQSFEAAIFEGENFLDTFEKGFKKMLARLASQLIASSIFKVLGTLIGGPLGGSLLGAASGIFGGGGFGGFRANGGTVQAGKSYVVGERQPELFVPRTSGTIIPQVPSHTQSATGGAMGVQRVEVFGNFELLNDRLVAAVDRGKRSRDRYKGY